MVEKKLDTNVLRGIAIMMVILIHVEQMIDGKNRYIVMASEFGQMGCQMFFILSGFGLCYAWKRINANSFGNGYLRFLKKRWMKIVPPYYIALILYMVCAVFERGFWGQSCSAIEPACLVSHLF